MDAGTLPALTLSDRLGFQPGGTSRWLWGQAPTNWAPTSRAREPQREQGRGTFSLRQTDMVHVSRAPSPALCGTPVRRAAPRMRLGGWELACSFLPLPQGLLSSGVRGTKCENVWPPEPGGGGMARHLTDSCLPWSNPEAPASTVNNFLASLEMGGARGAQSTVPANEIQGDIAGNF